MKKSRFSSLGRAIVHRGRRVHQDVESDQVGGAERRTPRTSDERTRERVDFFDAVLQLRHRANRRHHRKGADSIGDEIGRVLRDHDTLAEHDVAELAHEVEHGRVGARVRDQLEQMQVARRIEEVRTEEARAHRLGQDRRHIGDRKTRCIGGDDGAVFQVRGDALEQRALDVELLDDRFENPVALAQLLDVVFEIADRHATRARGRKECGRLRLRRALETRAREGVAVLARGRVALHLGAGGWNDVEQQCRDSGVGEMRGERTPHHTRAQHSGALDRDGQRKLLIVPQNSPAPLAIRSATPACQRGLGFRAYARHVPCPFGGSCAACFPDIPRRGSPCLRYARRRFPRVRVRLASPATRRQSNRRWRPRRTCRRRPTSCRSSRTRARATPSPHPTRAATKSSN